MKKIILLIIFLLMINLVNAKSLTVTPTIIDREYYLGDNQLSDISITIENKDNTSFAISLSKEGTSSNFFNISETSLYFNETQSKSFNVEFNIPQTTSTDLYTGKIKYGTESNEYIPVYINVKKRESLTECRLVIPEEYRQSIRRTTKPYTEDFAFKIASVCIDGISLLGIKEDKVYRMESGFQPIRLSGAIPSGEYEGGDTVSFTIEYDVSELAKETYTSNIIINAINKLNDASITKVLKFLITVTGDMPTQYEGNISTITTFPSCSISTTSLVANDTYEVVCSNVVDPNINIKMHPDLDYLEGMRVVNDEENKQFKWVFKPKKLGETTLKVSFELFGNPVGPTEEFKLYITTTYVSAGTSMKFALFGPDGKIENCDTLKGEDTLVIQMRDNKTDNIIANYVIYKDGSKIDGSSFTVEQGRNYLLSATSPNYHSVDLTCKIPNKPVSISLFPSEIEIGSQFSVTTNPENVTLYWDGSEIVSPYTPIVSGKHKLKAVEEGFQETEIEVDVKEKLSFLTEPPEKLKVDKETIIELNRPTTWTIYYGKKNDTMDMLYSAGESSIISFTPNEKGYYQLNIKENKYVWKTGFTWGNWFKNIVIGLVVILLIVLAIKVIKSRGGKKEESMEMRIKGEESD